jgi:GH25 family lysozyme M1 (1,4-beta-N-acetylmuramidase)
MIWLAQWGVKNPAFDCLIWQYADNGKVNGSSSRTDMNYYFGNLPNKNNNQEKYANRPQTGRKSQNQAPFC